jgi:hypothetical protein
MGAGKKSCARLPNDPNANAVSPEHRLYERPRKAAWNDPRRDAVRRICLRLGTPTTTRTRSFPAKPVPRSVKGALSTTVMSAC